MKLFRISPSEFFQKVQILENGWIGTIPGLDGLLMVETDVYGGAELEDTLAVTYGPWEELLGDNLDTVRYKEFVAEVNRLAMMDLDKRKNAIVRFDCWS